MIRLAYPAIGAIYTIPQSGWVAVHRRVELALMAQAIAPAMTKVMPSYPDLLVASQVWNSSVFPGLLRQAAEVVGLADQSIAQLGALKHAIAAIGSAATLPPELAAQAEAALAGLRGGAVAISATLGVLVAQLAQFARVNVSVDLDLRKFEGPLGANWPPLGQQLALVEDALGRTVGGWTALLSDLKDAAAPGVSLDLPFLLELDIASGIAGWTQIEADAAQFVGIATNLR